MSFHAERVLPYLTGTQSKTSAAQQIQALQTVLHECYHQRVETDAPNEPNAVRTRESKALDEGLTEYQAKRDVGPFAQHAGYGCMVSNRYEYPAAYQATAQLLAYAAPNPRDRDQLTQRLLDQRLVMRWDAVADEIVRSRLGGVVPPDPQHQRAARAALVRAMAHPNWQHLEKAREEKSGHNVAEYTRERLDAAIQDIGRHYSDLPSKPYPAEPLNHEAAPQQQGGRQQRTYDQNDRQPTQDLHASVQQASVQQATQRYASATAGCPARTTSRPDASAAGPAAGSAAWRRAPAATGPGDAGRVRRQRPSRGRDRLHAEPRRRRSRYGPPVPRPRPHPARSRRPLLTSRDSAESSRAQPRLNPCHKGPTNGDTPGHKGPMNG